MPLLYAGIDEAGYGPMLGPLCVALSAFRVEDWTPGDPAPNLWITLRSAVCRSGSDKKRRIPVADSKALKLANDAKTRHPLTHLERGVLCFLAAAQGIPGCDEELHGLLGADLEPAPWYAGDRLPLPVSCTLESLATSANPLRRALDRGRVSVAAMRCVAMGEASFNRIVERNGSKAATTGAAIVRHLRTVHALALAADPDTEVRIVCDRQGGRADYAYLIEAAWPGAAVEVHQQSPEVSRYSVRPAGDPPERPPIGLLFLCEAEDRHLPVALASMTAKFVRELAMARFNRYWSARATAAGLEALRPTAGYTQDARRWLQDAAPLLTEAERRAMVRLA